MAGLEHRTHKGGDSWRVHWREDGKRQQWTEPTRAKAEEFKARVEAYGNHWPPGTDPRGDKPSPTLTFAQWAAQAVEQRTRASAGTRERYRGDLERHLNPYFGHLAVDGITRGDVAAWVTALQIDTDDRKALSDKTLRNLHGFASSIMADALAHDPPLATRNPFTRTLPEFSQIRTEDMVMLSPGEFAMVLSFLREEYQPLIRLLAGTGLRFGEATALTVADVDLLSPRKTVTVTKAWKRIDGSRYVIGEPKTRRSRRTLGLSPELVELLIPLVSGRRGSELLFPDAQGNRLSHIEVWKRGWAPAVARARVCDPCLTEQQAGKARPVLRPKPCEHPGVLEKAPTLHGLRHSHASWLIAAGVPLAAISRRLGHSSITITVDRYGHLDPSMDLPINDAVDAALKVSEVGANLAS